MQDVKTELNIIVSHQDQVVAVPDDAIVIAGSDFCPYFFVQWSRSVVSIQGHPEWITAYSQKRIGDRQEILSEDVFNSALVSTEIPPDNAMFTRWLWNFIQA